MDNEPLTGKILQLWRDQVAYLPQQIFLMDDSLKNNITLGIPNDSINMKKIQIAIEQSQLTSLLEQLPQGLFPGLVLQYLKLKCFQNQHYNYLMVIPALLENAYRL